MIAAATISTIAPARIPAVIAVPSGDTQIGHAIFKPQPRTHQTMKKPTTSASQTTSTNSQ
jgi:hypothetical protein